MGDYIEDRIRLAKVMGLDVVAVTRAMGRVSVRYPDAEHGVNFDPFTDANDDYAVLEWMRKHDLWHKGMSWAIDNDRLVSQYQIGDYARAALKVIGDD